MTNPTMEKKRMNFFSRFDMEKGKKVGGRGDAATRVMPGWVDFVGESAIRVEPGWMGAGR